MLAFENDMADTDAMLGRLRRWEESAEGESWISAIRSSWSTSLTSTALQARRCCSEILSLHAEPPSSYMPAVEVTAKSVLDRPLCYTL